MVPKGVLGYAVPKIKMTGHYPIHNTCTNVIKSRYKAYILDGVRI